MADQVGRVLGDRYRLVAPIGRGGSANVFLADDVRLSRRVAVKVLHAALADDDAFLRRFRAEAQQAAALNHPNIMRVYDWGQSEDGPYLVLEYLGGGTLRDLLDRGHLLSPSQALLVGLEAARGLDYAHRRGLVHRDIKPANLLFDDEGRLCIADFGVARALAEAAWTEPAGAVLGTARYASPEQAQGLAVDGKADVYALALVIVESVTGQVPFSADTTIATLMGRVGVTLDVPEKLGPLAPVVQHAASPDPAQRLDARRLARALNQAAESLPAPAPLPLARQEAVASPPPGLVVDLTELGTRPALYDVEADRAQPQVELLPAARRRRRWWLWALLALLLAGVGTGVAYAVAQSRVPSRPVPALRGRTLPEARAAAARFKLKVRVSERRFDETAPVDTVLDQRPSRGRVKEGSTVSVVLSRGPPDRPVPDLSGLTQPVAEQRLRESGLVPKVSLAHSEDKPKGVVLDWTPKGPVPKGAEVSVTVSNGPAPRAVPPVAGRTYEEAVRLVALAGLKPARAEAFHDTVPAGKVIGTRPPAGTKLARDSTVTVVVSKGPDVVLVPNVGGQGVPQAQAILAQAGLPVTAVFGPPDRPVFTTNPPPGASVRRGTGVALHTR